MRQQLEPQMEPDGEQFLLPFASPTSLPLDAEAQSEPITAFHFRPTFEFSPTLQRLVDAPDEAPLALERFREWSGCCDPVQAIQTTTKHWLNEAGANPTPQASLVSLDSLCRTLGVDVRGGVSNQASSRVYSVWAPHSRKTGRTGCLKMSSNGPIILLPNTNDHALARIALAHELGHLLVLRRENSFDDISWGLPSTPEEEALAEYAARLFLLPSPWADPPERFSLAKGCVYTAGTRCVTIHSSVKRLRDADLTVPRLARVKATILWRIAPQSLAPSSDEHQAPRLTPQWFVCPNTFIPVGRCYARAGSLISNLCEGETGESAAEGQQEESVSIGGLKGRYLVDAFAWGSMKRGTRLVLSVFHSLT